MNKIEAIKKNVVEVIMCVNYRTKLKFRIKNNIIVDFLCNKLINNQLLTTIKPLKGDFNF